MGKVENSFYLEGIRRLISMDKAPRTDDRFLPNLKDQNCFGSPDNSHLTNGSSMTVPPAVDEDAAPPQQFMSVPLVPELTVTDLRDLLGEDMLTNFGIGELITFLI